MRNHALAPALVLAATACRVESDWVSYEFQSHAAQAERTSEREFDLAGERLTVALEHGRIHVRSVQGARPSIHGVFRTGAGSKTEAEALLASLSLAVTTVDGGTRVELAGAPEASGESYASVDLDFVVPTGVTVDLASDSGSVVIGGDGFRGAKLASAFGDLEAASVAGPVEAETSSGDVRLAHVRGPALSARTSFGTVVLEDVHADVGVTATSSSGDVTARDVDARQVVLTTSFGDVRAARVRAPTRALASSGSVTIEDATGPVEALSTFGDVRVEGVLDALEARTSSGSVSVTALPGSRVDGRWNLVSTFGDVLLWVPPGLAFQLEAETTFGSVHCGLPMDPPAPKGVDRKRLSAALRGGGGTVHLVTSSGDVRVLD